VAFTLLLVYGSMGGLAGVLVNAVLRPLLPAHSAEAHDGKLSWRDAVEVGAHLAGGAGIAALYWLSWGFAALVAIPWWGRGLAFGAACWTALVLPVLAAGTTQFRVTPARLGVIAFEWGCTCLFAALACARIWATLP